MTPEDAADAAQLCALHIMSTIKGIYVFMYIDIFSM